MSDENDQDLDDQDISNPETNRNLTNNFDEEQADTKSDDDEEPGISDHDDDQSEIEDDDLEPKAKKRRKLKRVRSEFIDDEAELSGDDEVSEDELELSDEDDLIDNELVDQDAKELDDDEEEEVRRLYHKQLQSEDKRTVLLLQEQLEDNDIAIGERRRRKFRWQTKDIMENSLGRHYNPDDDDSQEGEDDSEDDYDFTEPKRLRRPTTETLFLGNKKFVTKTLTDINPAKDPTSTSGGPVASGLIQSDDSNSNMASRMTATTSNNIGRFLYRDKETVQALSTKEVVVVSREDKEKNIQREVKRLLQSKSVFDQLYS